MNKCDRRGRFGLGCVWLTVGMAGCVLAPPPDSPEAAWTPPAAAVVEDSVWAEVRSRTMETNHPLALAEIIDLALRHGTATRKAWNEARAAAAQVQQARSYFMPELTGSVGGEYRGIEAATTNATQEYLRSGPGLAVNYLVINFGGGRRAAVEQALQTVYAANHAFNRALQDTLLAAQMAYYGVVSAQAGVAAAEVTLKDADAVLASAQARRAAGVGVELDVLQAQASLDQARYALAGAEGQCKAALGALAVTMGLPADTPVSVVPPAGEEPAALASADLRQLTDEALARRPDLAALRATLAARVAAVRVAAAPNWPSLLFNGSLNRNDYDVQSGRPMSDEDVNYGAGVSLQWKLFDGDRTASARRAAEAQADAARAAVAQAELAASADVWSRFHGYETARQKHRFSAAYLASATAAHVTATDSYKAGLGSILDLLSAETQLAQARSRQVQARQEVFTALAQLAYALGTLGDGGAGALPPVHPPSRKEP